MANADPQIRTLYGPALKVRQECLKELEASADASALRVYLSTRERRGKILMLTEDVGFDGTLLVKRREKVRGYSVRTFYTRLEPSECGDPAHLAKRLAEVGSVVLSRAELPGKSPELRLVNKTDSRAVQSCDYAAIRDIECYARRTKAIEPPKQVVNQVFPDWLTRPTFLLWEDISPSGSDEGPR